MGMLGVTGRVALAKNGVAAADVTPNAVNWCDLPINGELGAGWGGSRQITGISTSITLGVEIPNGNFLLYYKLFDSAYDIGEGPGNCGTDFNSFTGWTLLSNNSTFSVDNNKHVGFRSTSGSGGSATLVTVKNTSDGNATLDTFYIGPEN